MNKTNDLNFLLVASLPHLKARLNTLKAMFPGSLPLKQREELQLLIDRINITIGGMEKELEQDKAELLKELDVALDMADHYNETERLKRWGALIARMDGTDQDYNLWPSMPPSVGRLNPYAPFVKKEEK